MISADDLKKLRAKLKTRNMYLRKRKGSWLYGAYEVGPRPGELPENRFVYFTRSVDTAEEVEQYIKDADACMLPYMTKVTT